MSANRAQTPGEASKTASKSELSRRSAAKEEKNNFLIFDPRPVDDGKKISFHRNIFLALVFQVENANQKNRGGGKTTFCASNGKQIFLSNLFFRFTPISFR
jgi:hypothetical protein